MLLRNDERILPKPVSTTLSSLGSPLNRWQAEIVGTRQLWAIREDRDLRDKKSSLWIESFVSILQSFDDKFVENFFCWQGNVKEIAYSPVTYEGILSLKRPCSHESN